MKGNFFEENQVERNEGKKENKEEEEKTTNESSNSNWNCAEKNLKKKKS